MTDTGREKGGEERKDDDTPDDAPENTILDPDRKTL